MLRKVVRFRNFLRTWLPRRQSLVGADTSNETGCFQSQILVNQKKKFLVEGTWNLSFAEPPSRLSWSFFFLLSHAPSCGDRPPSLVFFFSFSRPPFFWRQTSPGGLNGFHVRALVCSSSEKNPSLSLATCRTKKLDGESCR